MNPFFRNVAVLLFCAFVMSACAAPSAQTLAQNNSAAAAALPTDYRVLIARYILAHAPLESMALDTAMISNPYDDRGAPLWRNIDPDHTPAVCVAYDTRTLFGTGRAYMLFTIRNGQVRRMYTHNNAILFTEGMCPDYTPFTELMK